MIRFGPAGWSYPDSPGRVYPAAAPKTFDVLAYLASYFDTIEINASFYAPQPVRNYESWAKRVTHNEHFRFTAKLWQLFTHGIRAYGRRPGSSGRETGDGSPQDWTREDVALVTEGFQVLRDANLLGAVLAQFPLSFKPEPASIERLEMLAEHFAGWPFVVELRHVAWGERDHLLHLKRLGMGFANIDQPTIGDGLGATARVTGDIGYVRFHGRRFDTWFKGGDDGAERYNYLYTAEELEPWAERIERIAQTEGVRDVYVVSNNHFEGKGPANALMLRSMIEKKKVAAPPVLFETYRDSLRDYAVPTDRNPRENTQGVLF